jgi:pyridoxal phosphate enzyme (YggS family)
VRLGICFYDGVLPIEQSSFENRLAAVEDRIRNALQRCGRKRSEITLVAVSKKFSAESIREAYRAGLRDFGENYVQEFADKHPLLRDLPGAKFHLIGHLQSNKSRLACDLFQVIQTVDTPKLLQRLNSAAEEKEVRRDVMLEVKLGNEGSKSGAAPDDIPKLLTEAARCPHLNLLGLMTIPPWSENPETSRPYFQRLRELARRHHLANLSMGMSADFEAAIEEGSTIIRVGTALFGPRPKPQNF